MTHNQFIKLFRDIATNHKDINTFGDGDIEKYTKNEISSSKGQTLWVNVKPKTIGETTQKKVYTFWIMDIVNEDFSNEAEVISDTERTFEDIIAILRSLYYNDFFMLDETITVEPFAERYATKVAGWVADITFKELFEADACQANISAAPTITGITT